MLSTQRKNILKEISYSKYIYLFAIFSLLASILSANLIGIFFSFGIGIVFSIFFIYILNNSFNLSKLILKAIPLLSVFAAIIGILQYIDYNTQLYDFFLFNIFKNIHGRVPSVFFNPNFYATILEFITIVCIYNIFIRNTDLIRKIYYFAILLLNLIMLYLTGCRTAWFAILLAVPIMLLLKKKFNLTLIFAIIYSIALVIALKYDLFPRLHSILNDFYDRVCIWYTAFKAFLEKPIIGYGPFGFLNIYQPCSGPNTVHTHSLYIDIFFSQGLIGASLMVMFIIQYLIEYFKRNFVSSFIIASGVITIILIHGIFDYTIFNFQVSLLFLFLLNIQTTTLRKNYD